MTVTRQHGPPPFLTPSLPTVSSAPPEETSLCLGQATRTPFQTHQRSHSQVLPSTCLHTPGCHDCICTHVCVCVGVCSPYTYAQTYLGPHLTVKTRENLQFDTPPSVLSVLTCCPCHHPSSLHSLPSDTIGLWVPCSCLSTSGQNAHSGFTASPLCPNRSLFK